MFICLCNGVTDDMIRDEVVKGNNNIDKIIESLNVTNICGSCKDEVESLMLQFVKID